MAHNILLVEDDPALSFATKYYLSKRDYKIVDCLNAESAYQKFMKKIFDLCVIDIVLPGKSGLELVRQIRAKNNQLPIIITSSNAADDERITGMEAGADCYLTKPFSLHELMLRMQVFLKYKKNSDQPQQRYTIGRFVFDFHEMKLSLPEQKFDQVLTQREAELLHYLYVNAGKVIKREEILVDLWGKMDPYLGRSLDVFINKLRKYFRFEPNIEIKTIHGVGFKVAFGHESHMEEMAPGITQNEQQAIHH